MTGKFTPFQFTAMDNTTTQTLEHAFLRMQAIRDRLLWASSEGKTRLNEALRETDRLISSAPPEIVQDLGRSLQQRVEKAQALAEENQRLLEHLASFPSQSSLISPLTPRRPIIGRMLWQSKTSQQVKSIGPLSGDGRTVFGVVDYPKAYDSTRVWAFDAATGKVRWKSRVSWVSFLLGHGPHFGDGPHSSLGPRSLSPDGRLLFARDGWHVKALDTATGKARWKSEEGGTEPAVSPDGRIVIARTSQGAFAVDASTGRIRWKKSVAGGKISSKGTFGSQGHVFFSTRDGEIHALTAENGNTCWESTTGKKLWNIMTSSNGNIVFAQTNQGTPKPRHEGEVAALDASTGAVRWQSETANTIFRLVAVSPDDQTLFTLTTDPETLALDAGTGESLWQTQTGRIAWNSGISANGSTLFGKTENNEAFLMDPASGKILWTSEANRSIENVGPISADGRMLFAKSPGKIYAFSIEESL